MSGGPVAFVFPVRRLASEGVTTYVEVGPGTVLSGLVRKMQREATVISFGAPDDLEAVEKMLASRSTSSGHPEPAER